MSSSTGRDTGSRDGNHHLILLVNLFALSELT